tara:strand:- start:282 stop:614 length:333 start_codon:yes stop_codon:yes gene_type:complete
MQDNSAIFFIFFGRIITVDCGVECSNVIKNVLRLFFRFGTFPASNMARPTNHIDRRFYPVKEIADLLNMDVKWVRERINSGDFLAFKRGTKFRVSGASVNRWIDKHLVAA